MSASSAVRVDEALSSIPSAQTRLFAPVFTAGKIVSSARLSAVIFPFAAINRPAASSSLWNTVIELPYMFPVNSFTVLLVPFWFTFISPFAART